MDRNEIVRTFLDAGYQLAGDGLAYFEQNQDKIQEFMGLVAGNVTKPFITRQFVEETLSKVSPRVRMVRNFFAKKKETTANDVANMLSKRYEFVSGILSKRPELINLISINRISQQTKRFSMIAIVKEVNPGDRSVVVEDPTGSTPVYVGDEAAGEFNYLVEDEVVGIVCDNEESSENRAVKIVMPDIPLNLKATTSESEISCMFLSDIHMDEPRFMPHSLEKLAAYLKKIKEETIIFILGDVSSDEEKTKKFLEMFPENYSVMTLKGELEGRSEDNFLPDPVVVEVSGVKIFLSHGKIFAEYAKGMKTSPENVVLQLLKKRHLSPTFNFNPNLDDEKMTVDQPADIYVIGHFHAPHMMNYKGVTLISLGSFVTQPVFWSVNLKTRETIKIDLT